MEVENLAAQLQLEAASITEKSPSESQPNNGDSIALRHCAFCLEVCGFPVKFCGGCKRRAYCSKKCQVTDWKVTCNGQRHKNWCGRYEHGKEDVDYEVVPIPNKGLGVRAKRLFPAGFRIIVEPVFTDPHGHPGIKDLHPKGEEYSLEDKFEKNSFHGDPKLDGGKSFVGLRSSRVNHSCRPNASMSYDRDARALIISSIREIQPGEEILISYYVHLMSYENNSNLLMDMWNLKEGLDPFEHEKEHLKTKWGIICPDDCACRDPEVRLLAMKGKPLFRKMLSSMEKGRTMDVCIAAEMVLDIYDQLVNISWVQRGEVIMVLVSERLKLEGHYSMDLKHRVLEWLKINQVIFPFSPINHDLERIIKRNGW